MRCRGHMEQQSKPTAWGCFTHHPIYSLKPKNLNPKMGTWAFRIRSGDRAQAAIFQIQEDPVQV